MDAVPSELGVMEGGHTPLLLRAADAAARCGISLRTWRMWDAGGKVPAAVRIGRATFWRPSELHAWVAAGCPDRSTGQSMQN
jgi:predicted DNA-binding transcriptional regulator AlpA